MKNLLHIAFAFLFMICAVSFTSRAAVVPVSGTITTNTTWTSSNIYVLNGFVYVKSGATLTIEAGTIIKGDKASKGTLIITSTGKINAVGTDCNPIVFTSNQPAGDREPGDWGGVIILGNAPINLKDSLGNSIRGIIEGGVDNAANDGKYGGSDANDNSGSFRYVRIEYPGIAFVTNNEINGLTLGGVGAGTTIDHIQISYSGDDSYEFFGGTVNAKYLIAIGTTDDDFDTDFGYSGKLQFLLAVRDSSYYDAAGASNGFESDNDGTGTLNTPLTSATFSNVTLIGPKPTTSTSVATYFKRGMHIRKSSNISVFNSVIIGWQIGEFIESSNSQNAFTSGAAEMKYNVWAGCNINHEKSFDSTFVPLSANNNNFYPMAASAMLTNPFGYTTNNAMPASGSLLLTGADFTSSKLTSSFFEKTGTFRGAFGTTNWAACWSNFNPQASLYNNVSDIISIQSINLYPNPTSQTTSLEIYSDKNMEASIVVIDMNGQTVLPVHTGAIQSGVSTFEIQAQNLTKGIYFVRILSENNSEIKKLIIQ